MLHDSVASRRFVIGSAALLQNMIRGRDAARVRSGVREPMSAVWALNFGELKGVHGVVAYNPEDDQLGRPQQLVNIVFKLKLGVWMA